MKRRTVIGGLAAAAIAAVGGVAYKFHHVARHYPPTPYDDLLNQIVDRAPAARLGAVAVKTMPDVSLGQLATQLRQPGWELARRAPLDAAQNRTAEVGGWVVPQSVALYAALAAQVKA